MKRSIIPIVIVLLIITVVLIVYRIVWLGYPVFPGALQQTWRIQFQSHISGNNKETILLLALPSERHGQAILDEKITSHTFAFNVFQDKDNRIGAWSGIIGSPGGLINYNSTVIAGPPSNQKSNNVVSASVYPSAVTEADQKLAIQTVRQWSNLALPARLQSVLLFLSETYKKENSSTGISLELSNLLKKYDKETLTLTFLKASDIPAEIIEGFELTDGIITNPARYIAIRMGEEWQYVTIDSLELRKQDHSFLPLATGGVPILRISNGDLTETRWNISRSVIDQWGLNFERIRKSENFLDQWSLFHLPEEYQRTFRFLLLIPIGALLISFLRNFIGFSTFGIFMPVLMALAFRNTGLVYGLLMFAGIVFTGYIARLFLNRYRLLLVPRMSVLLTLVIALFTLLALLGNKIGLREIMAVGLLPFVILAMTIERFFIIVEEHDMATAVRTALGSAAVSVIIYFIISWELLQITFFTYPELLLPTIAFQMLAGRYTGYRMSEFIRFRSFIKKDNNEPSA